MEQFAGRVFGGLHHGRRYDVTIPDCLQLSDPIDLRGVPPLDFWETPVNVSRYRKATFASRSQRVTVWVPEAVPPGREMEYILLVALEAGHFGAEYDRRVREGEFEDGPDNDTEQRQSEAAADPYRAVP